MKSKWLPLQWDQQLDSRKRWRLTELGLDLKLAAMWLFLFVVVLGFIATVPLASSRGVAGIRILLLCVFFPVMIDPTGRCLCTMAW